MPIVLTHSRRKGLSREQNLLADYGAMLVENLMVSPEIQIYAIPGQTIAVHVLFGHKRDCWSWNVTSKALGFHAVCSSRRYDSNTGEPWHSVADKHLAVVNMDAAIKVLQENWDNYSHLDRSCDLASWFMTIPHEILHALEWVRETNGRTPLEVYDRDGGEHGLIATNEKIDSRLGDAEDAIEAMSSRLTDTYLPDDAMKLVDTLFTEGLSNPGRKP